jgi:hypothetical protein
MRSAIYSCRALKALATRAEHAELAGTVRSQDRDTEDRDAQQFRSGLNGLALDDSELDPRGQCTGNKGNLQTAHVLENVFMGQDGHPVPEGTSCLRVGDLAASLGTGREPLSSHGVHRSERCRPNSGLRRLAFRNRGVPRNRSPPRADAGYARQGSLHVTPTLLLTLRSFASARRARTKR